MPGMKVNTQFTSAQAAKAQGLDATESFKGQMELARQGILQIADAPLAPPATPSTVSP